MKRFRPERSARLHKCWFAVLCAAILSATSGRAQSWQLGPFVRPASGNPVITPDKTAVFDDPILQAPVHWEALHTFNPAAIVRDGKVYVLYRAEDDSGTMQIGMHTSRLGLGVSEDGIHFLRLRRPVFFPADDDQKSREWPGGVEDPRIVEAPDGTYVLTYTQWNRETYSVGIATSKDLLHVDEAWAGFWKRGQVREADVQVGGDFDSPRAWAVDCGEDSWNVLDVLGRDPYSPGDVAGLDSLDSGRSAWARWEW